jgi:hypothetical protein
MDTRVLERRFEVIGARLKVEDRPWHGMPTIDVRADRRGEYFDLRFSGRGREVELDVVDAVPGVRHLLLLVRDGGEKSKFLFGHDERHWFVTAIPETAWGVSGVAEAMRALQPDAVRDAVRRAKPKNPLRRKNKAFIRQGEWFFVPEPDLAVADSLVLHDEPLSRGGGTAHLMELAFRRGGETVYVSRRHPRGLTHDEFRALTDRERRSESWDRMVRDAEVYARGAIRHPDHATVVLPGWHRVLMNTEQEARAMRHVAFLD